MPSRAANACCASPFSNRSRRTVRPIKARDILHILYRTAILSVKIATHLPRRSKMWAELRTRM
jgi:hypothetical protein